jgi:hypothetical protein
VCGCTRLNASQGSVPAGLTPASDSSFCFQCKEGSGLALRRPIEITPFIRHWSLKAMRRAGNRNHRVLATAKMLRAFAIYGNEQIPLGFFFFVEFCCKLFKEPRCLARPFCVAFRCREYFPELFFHMSSQRLIAVAGIASSYHTTAPMTEIRRSPRPARQYRFEVRN